MDFFSDDFKQRLYSTIEDIEKSSLVEVVAIVRQQSDKYTDIACKYAAAIAIIIFTLLMIIPSEINYYIIYFATIFSYLLTYFGIIALKPLHSQLVSTKRKNKSVDILARAIFQKGGIRFTENRTGILFFVSIFEKKVMILADRTVNTSIPAEEMQEIQKHFDNIFNTKKPAENFLKQLSATKEIFSKYIPPVENDINELPDNLTVDL